MRQLFYLNAHARDHLEMFLVIAINSLLLVRYLCSMRMTYI